MSDKQPSSSGPDVPATALLDALRFLSNDLYAACREYGHIASCASPEYRAVCEARACTLSVIAGSIKKTVDHITSNISHQRQAESGTLHGVVWQGESS